MKKLLLLLAVSIFLIACGSKEKTSESKVSAEMKSFMDKLDGKSASVTAAVKEYGKEGLDEADMDLYDLREPKVIETNGNCYLMSAKSGVTVRKYNICWQDGKISSVEDKGME